MNNQFMNNNNNNNNYYYIKDNHHNYKMSNPMNGNQPKNNSSTSVKSADGSLRKTQNEENTCIHSFKVNIHLV